MPHELLVMAPLMVAVYFVFDLARYGLRTNHFVFIQAPVVATALLLGAEGAFSILVDFSEYFPPNRPPYLLAGIACIISFSILCIAGIGMAIVAGSRMSLEENTTR